MMQSQAPRWERVRNILAFPHGWQRPAKTEEWAYERCLAGLADSPHAQMLCFPWASLVDLQRRGGAARAALFLNALKRCPPKTTLLRATVMQHVYALDLLPLLQRLGVTDLFWAHATQAETAVGGLRVHPFPLYPVCCAGEPGAAGLPAAQRRYLYSFVGAYQPGLYLDAARRWIFDLPPRPDACVQRRGEWHFERAVYREQIGGEPPGAAALQAEQACAAEYRDILAQSTFSLCPSGSGPNTIRLWESLGLGAVPVVISPTHRLPGEWAEWEGAAVFAAADPAAVAALPGRLAQMLADGEAARRQALLPALWRRHGLTPEQDLAATLATVLARLARQAQ